MSYSLSGQTDDNTSSGSNLSQTFGGLSKGSSDNQMIIIGVIVVAALLIVSKKGR